MGKKRNHRRSRSTQRGWFAAKGKYVALGLLAAITVGVIGFAVTGGANTYSAEELAAAREQQNAALAQTAAEKEAAAEEARLAALLQVARPTDGRPLKVVFAGDSLTYGLFASSEAAGYRPQVVSALEQGGPVEWTRGGKTGNTVGATADTITPDTDTNLVVLALGTNDVWKTEVPDFTAQYTGLVEKVRATAPNTAIMCLGVWANPDGARLYDPLVEAACEASGGAFVAIGDLYEPTENRGPAGVEAFGGVSDNFHPNDAGYAAIAKRVLASMRVQ